TPLCMSCREIVARRMWSFGKVRWAGTIWNVIVGRALHLSDGQEILRQAKLPPRSIVFVPTLVSRNPVAPEHSPMVISLGSVVAWGDGHVCFDEEYVEQQIIAETAAISARKAKPRPAKRATRAATIELLTKCLQEHVQAAKTHAQTTAEHRG